jgi:ferric-dicitrate binding protein FerR (iron transport regulator)
VELTGEAYFEVQRDEKRPFKVVSGTQIVEVLGTSFNICSYPDDPETLTTLVEGKVNVFLEGNPEIRQTLLPNHQSLLLKDEATIEQREVDIREYIAWKEGMFYFTDQSLGDIMKTLSRWYDVDVIFTDARAADILFTGHIKRYENFEKILDLIEQTNEVTFKKERGKIAIDFI